MSQLFSPFALRSVQLRNRVGVSPMCQYSAVEGMPTPWHVVHLGSRAVGGAGLVIVEATGVSPEARITPFDLGLWNDAQRDALAPIAALLRSQGAAPGIQLAHAGRKASTDAPWRGGGMLGPERGGWEPVAPSALRFSEHSALPRVLDEAGLAKVVGDFEAAAKRALDAGFEVIELHLAHGYLLHQFLSPLTNRREDAYGGSFENRIRLPLAVVEAVRRVVPENLPLLVRISATDWVEGGWDLNEAIAFCRALAERGVDLIDCSSGGTVPEARIPAAAGYQVPFAEAIRRATGLATAAVGMITEPGHAQEIVASDQADLVLIGRAMLADPYWALHAAGALGAPQPWPDPYLRAVPPKR